MRRLLIANRGEIAVRIARGARELGISPVGVYSDADEHAAFRDALDESLRIGPGPATESYLDAGNIVAAARTLGADAVHPGYGFLSERAPFAQACADAGLIFVGPSPAAIAAVGSKIEAKRRARAAGVAVVPGYDGDDQSDATLRREAAVVGTPLLVKAAAGGGGRGMRVVTDLATFDEALASARREALASFGDDTMLLERYVQRPRHVEIQILADTHGTIVYLGERECSIQRRHQKVVEEAPSPALDGATRAAMGDAAVAVARAVGYTNAGTVEFVLDEDGRFYFLEVNARLQVEHPVTELVYGVDLVHEQLRIADGGALALRQTDLIPRGWAIEVRLNAEDPAHEFRPSIGTVTAFEVPAAPGVRVDTGVRAGSEISPYYDSMIAKVIVWGADRPAAIARLRTTLAATRVGGVATNLPLLRAIAADDAFAAGATTTRYLEERMSGFGLEAAAVDDRVKLAALGVLLADEPGWRLGGVGIPLAALVDGILVRAAATRNGAGRWTIDGDVTATVALDVRGERVEIARDGAPPQHVERAAGAFTLDGRRYALEPAPPPSADAEHGAHAGGSGSVTAPMPGKIASVAVREGDAVEPRALLIVLEAMKMEHRIEAPVAGTVRTLLVKAGDLVMGGATLATIEP